MDLTPDKIERGELHAGARLEPRHQSKDGYGNERRRQEDPIEERAGWRSGAEKRQSRENDDAMDVGPKPRQRAILLAQERRIEGRLGSLEARRSAASTDSVGRHAFSHSRNPCCRWRSRRKLLWRTKPSASSAPRG